MIPQGGVGFVHNSAKSGGILFGERFFGFEHSRGFLDDVNAAPSDAFWQNAHEIIQIRHAKVTKGFAASRRNILQAFSAIVDALFQFYLSGCPRDSGISEKEVPSVVQELDRPSTGDPHIDDGQGACSRSYARKVIVNRHLFFP